MNRIDNTAGFAFPLPVPIDNTAGCAMPTTAIFTNTGGGTADCTDKSVVGVLLLVVPKSVKADQAATPPSVLNP